MKYSELEWLQPVLRFDDSNIPEDSEVHFQFTNAPESWQVFLLVGIVAGLCYLIFTLYRRELASCPTWGKRLLTGIRVAVLMVLVLVFLGPAITYTQRTIYRGEIVVLRDASASLATRDTYDQDDALAGKIAKLMGISVESLRANPPSRAEIVDNVLTKNQQQLLNELRRRGRVRIVDFARGVEPRQTLAFLQDRPDKPESDLPASIQIEPLRPEGDITDLHKAILSGLKDRDTAGVVIFTEGQHTATSTTDDDLSKVASKASNANIPLLFVGVGDPAQRKELVIASVSADPFAWKDEAFEVRAVLQPRGFGEERVTAKLIETEVFDTEQEGQKPASREIKRVDVELPDSGNQVSVAFQHTPKKAGRYSYSIEIEPLGTDLKEQEIIPATPAQVKVVSNKPRILVIAGAPTWEYQGLQRLLEREDKLEYACWLQSLDTDRAQDGSILIQQLPQNREELFAYDMVLMIDPNPDEFSEEWMTTLQQFVSEHAGGLLYVAGPKFTSQFLASAQTQKIQKLLPVQFEDLAQIQATIFLTSHTQPQQLEAVHDNRDQPIMAFYQEAREGRARIEDLPGFYWSFPCEKAKPGARVLLEHRDAVHRNRPILVTGRYGYGNTVFLGFNGTWRWRRVGHNAELFDSFWIEVVHYLIDGRKLEGRGRGRMDAGRAVYYLGDSVTLTAKLKNPSAEPLDWKQVPIEIQINGEDPTEHIMTPVPNSSEAGVYELSLPARRSGVYRATVRMRDNLTQGVANVETLFEVKVPDAETIDKRLRRDKLEKLAQDSGGSYRDIYSIDEKSEIDAWLDTIKDKSRPIEAQSKPIPIWDHSMILIILVTLLGVEWAFRKGFKLL